MEVLEVLVENKKKSRSKYTHHLQFRNEWNIKELADVTTFTDTLKTEEGMKIKYTTVLIKWKATVFFDVCNYL